MRVVLVVLAIAVLSVSSQYSLKTEFAGTTFFNGWSFYTAGDPTGGDVNYVSQQVATAKGYIANRGDQVYIGSDHVGKANGTRGRDSVRISTTQVFNSGLFIFDLTHMPSGCGTWPAYWLVGPGWPSGGEIDVIEGINNNTMVTTTLHTNQGCTMANESATMFTGKWALGANGLPAEDCYINAKGQLANQGCSIIGAADSYGDPFNKAGGGVYVTEWTEDFIQMWLFSRTAIPQDITSKKPDPSGWGKPYAYFQLGATNCPISHFKNNQVVINLTFCGQWAGGNNFKKQCPTMGTCSDWVRNHPEEFTEAYWLINYLDIYQK